MFMYQKIEPGTPFLAVKIKRAKWSKNLHAGPTVFQLIKVRFDPVENADFIAKVEAIGGVRRVELTNRKLVVWSDPSMSWRWVKHQVLYLLHDHYQVNLKVINA